MEWKELHALELLKISTTKNWDVLENSLLFTPEYEDVLSPMPSVKDLGVMIDANMDWKPQRSKAIRKANQKAGWILCTFSTRNMSLLRTLWKSLVQPHLDYCSQMWAPSKCVGASRDLEGTL